MSREQPRHTPLKINGVMYTGWQEYKLINDPDYFEWLKRHPNQYQLARINYLEGKRHPNRHIEVWHK